MNKPLTIKQEAFSVEYVRCGNASDAYRFAYNAEKMKSVTINRKAAELMDNGGVAARIAELRAIVAKKAEFTLLDVLRHWVEIATANPADLVQLRRECCRHCYGINHEYHWGEMEYALACAKMIDASKRAPDAPGGFGFTPNREPNAHCPMCYGKGIEIVHAADTRTLRGAAARLYGGLKQTRTGVEIIFRSQNDALKEIAKFYGMGKDGAIPGNPRVLPKISEVTNDPVQAARIYQEIIMGN